MSDNQTPLPPEQSPTSEPPMRREQAEPAGDAETPPPAAFPSGPEVPPSAEPQVASGSAPTVPDFPPSREPIASPSGLDEGTYTALREPRGRGVALDGSWHQISPKYVVSQVVQEVAVLVIVAIAAVVVASFTGEWWPWVVGGAIAAITLVSLIILPRQARALGYMLRGDDIVFRKGILWQRMVAVPYGRMQLIDITHGPLDRIFGVSKLKMVTAAASTGVEIPGLSESAAEALRDTLIEVAETRRTGL